MTFLEGVASFLATYALHSTVAIACGAAIAALTPRSVARARVWKWAIVGGLLSAALATVPSGHGRWIPTGQVVTLPSLSRSGDPGPPRGASGESFASTPGERRPFWLGVVAIWIAGATIGLARLEIGRRKEARSLAPRAETDLARLKEVADLAAGLRGGGRVRVTRSETLAVPAVLPGRVLCLPSSFFDQLEPGPRRAVLMHELAHVRRRDPEWRLGLEVLARVFFFQPLARLAIRRWAFEKEAAADEAAVARTGRPRDLVIGLTTLAKAVGPRPAVAADPGRRSAIVRRARRILAPPRARRGADVAAFVLALSSGGALLAGVPSLRVLPEILTGSAAERVVNITIENEVGPRYVRIEGRGVHLSANDGVVGLEANGRLEIVERISGVEKRASARPSVEGPRWRGHVDGTALFPEGARTLASSLIAEFTH